MSSLIHLRKALGHSANSVRNTFSERDQSVRGGDTSDWVSTYAGGNPF